MKIRGMEAGAGVTGRGNMRLPHYAYYGITLNFASIAEFSLKARRIWFKRFNRLSAQSSGFTFNH
ncbi:MAG: hypothetical protein LBQ88_00365 [Treponema sp.]|nr:hypothetical protein [Treponema sp.]